mmetsp:Transcript_28008/g.61710  ORF Transcript_28008/g.61710 Transcript_28008/m.61710 type:complete len:238 (-) Transcript_28008:1207-1920(-)
MHRLSPRTETMMIFPENTNNCRGETACVSSFSDELPFHPSVSLHGYPRIGLRPHHYCCRCRCTPNGSPRRCRCCRSWCCYNCCCRYIPHIAVVVVVLAVVFVHRCPPQLVVPAPFSEPASGTGPGSRPASHQGSAACLPGPERVFAPAACSNGSPRQEQRRPPPVSRNGSSRSTPRASRSFRPPHRAQRWPWWSTAARPPCGRKSHGPPFGRSRVGSVVFVPATNTARCTGGRTCPV